MRFKLQSKHDTMVWGRAFGALLQPGDVAALIGDLGSGKTTLTQAIAAGLGVADTVTSPTFSLIQEYAGPVPLYHFDPYRLDRPEEIWELGLDEYLQREGVVIVEWADLIEPLLPQDRYVIRLDILDTRGTIDMSENCARRLSIDALGKRASCVVSQLVLLPTVADMLAENEAENA